MKKADEMEMYITLKSIKIAWLFTVIYLLVWSVYDTLKTSQIGLPLILLLAQNVVFYTCILFFRHRVSGSHEE
ncbi:hypothetical protein SDC9_172927 [bioreactor metagenome]|uniref:Uncharacterized protein n=1 Tax=bioreactor metagenome TaxID=1076179 RepID=A0A645GFP5_9ZZZZ|nr:hypothetical protein [Syntrophomonadaceae bacterium]